MTITERLEFDRPHLRSKQKKENVCMSSEDHSHVLGWYVTRPETLGSVTSARFEERSVGSLKTPLDRTWLRKATVGEAWKKESLAGADRLYCTSQVVWNSICSGSFLPVTYSIIT